MSWPGVMLPLDLRDEDEEKLLAVTRDFARGQGLAYGNAPRFSGGKKILSASVADDRLRSTRHLMLITGACPQPKPTYCALFYQSALTEPGSIERLVAAYREMAIATFDTRVGASIVLERGAK
ncbi:hypothetical protein [Roseiterribacter gracilis]|uniref:hypothetical protein n=1 Tax=Roseiterribacter gracilis TaxID=2812848 RepID=UPI003B43749C